MKKQTFLSIFFVIFACLYSINASAFCWFNCNYTKTKDPIVLVHGIMGWDTLIGGLDYWYGIVDSLEDGGAKVYVVEVSPLNDAAFRGESVIQQLDEIRAITGKPNQKFNLIGHSQGGIDIRYVAGVRPDLAVSVTTIGTPHGGLDTALSDSFGGLEVSEELNNALGDVISTFWSILGGSSEEVDISAVMEDYSPAGVAAFDSQFPDGLPTTYCGEGAASTQTTYGTIRNYSWTGDNWATNALDPVDYLLVILASLYDDPHSDGIVPVCFTHFGDVIRDNYTMNHLDEVNQMFGLTSWFEVNPKTLFRNHANRLKKAGL